MSAPPPPPRTAVIPPRRLSVLLFYAALCVPAAAGEPAEIRWDWANATGGAVIGRVNVGGFAVPLTGTLEGAATVTDGRLIPGKAGFLRVRDLEPNDGGPGSLLAAGNGGAISVTAAVFPEPLPVGRFGHLLCKGRTHNDGRPDRNLNYALRLAGLPGDRAALSFLFADEGGGFHRWTSAASIPCDGESHRLAFAYAFGKPESLRAYLDGRSTGGDWDMDGATTAAPVTDADYLWIGSAMGGAEGSTFRGAIGPVRLVRGVLSERELTFRPPVAAARPAPRAPAGRVLVETIADVPGKARAWGFPLPVRGSDSYTQAAFGFPAVAAAYGPTGSRIDRGPAFVLRARGRVTLPAGDWELLVRSRGGSRTFFDEQEVAATRFFARSSSAHGPMYPPGLADGPGVRAVRAGDAEALHRFTADGKEIRVRFEAYVGGNGRRRETGEAGLWVRPLDAGGDPAGPFRLLDPSAGGPSLGEPLTDAGWFAYTDRFEKALRTLNAARRRAAAADEDRYWADRHARVRRTYARRAEVPAPTPGLRATGAVDHCLNAELHAAGVEPGEPVDDAAFLRRLTLDVVGRVPVPGEIARFLADPPDSRRANAVDRLLADSLGWADGWMGEWQDALAENPAIVNPTLNNTGPFREWLHEALLDNLPADRFATELIRMDGAARSGGAGGFALATQNDAPFAAKAHVLGQAFLASDMTCARCHDAPGRPFLQRDLFGFAAMLKRSPQEVPPGSSLPPDLVGRAAVEVTLTPGERVEPAFTLAGLRDGEPDPALFHPALTADPGDTRERLALLVTGPRNRRFAEVMVNRLWTRYLGRGIVDTPHDWSFGEPSHPALLAFLADELTLSGYDLKHVAQLILTSDAYGRQVVGGIDERRLFAGPTRRRMTAEQVVDSLFAACGKRFKAGLVAIDADGARAEDQSVNFGRPRRAWQFASLSTDRDRQSLTLPRAEPFVELLDAFGWRGARPDPRHVRDDGPNVVQPALLENGVLAARFTRLSGDSRFTAIALEADTLGDLTDRTVRAVFTRGPTAAERDLFRDLLTEGFADRRTGAPADPPHFLPSPGVSWSNQFQPEAGRRQLELRAAVEAGDPPTARLAADWRERYEDLLWALLNSPEFVFVP